MKKPLPDQQLLIEYLRYEPDTGKLYWKSRSACRFKRSCSYQSFENNFAGREAFTAGDGAGYKHGHIDRTKYLAHRIIWKIAHGYDPVFIDHVNGNITDNRLHNLRDVTSRENGRNKRTSRRNTSGVTGVSWRRKTETWIAYIKVDSKLLHLGVYEDKSDAVNARKNAERKLGFHSNHGRNISTTTDT